MMHILSLGAGVQSSTLALMAAHGELPMPDCAIFADTGDEPKHVYAWLDWLEKQLPFPVHRVGRSEKLSRRSIATHTSKRTGQVYMKSLIPAFVIRPNGTLILMGRRCTADHKIAPIMRKAKELAKVPRGQKTPIVTQWIGISTDEAQRMKPSREPWSTSIWPLIDANMSRQDCLIWMAKHKYPTPPKSSCVFCPFHSDEMWRELRDQHPDEFAEVAQFEREMQAAAEKQTGTARFHGVPYLHRSGSPIDMVDFKQAPGHAQMDLFGNECEGMCGV
jgi:hypothetical protein